MPYCSKCDMEFIEGITVCSDCGSPLYESEEAAKAARKQAEEQAMEKARKEWEEAMGGNAQDLEEAMDDGFWDAEGNAEENPADYAPSGQKKRKAPAASVYVKKSARYQDMKSSALAFLLIGCAAIAVAIVSFIHLVSAAPESVGFYQIGSHIVSVHLMAASRSALFVLLSLICFIVSAKTNIAAAAMKEEAAKENAKTENLIALFLAIHSPEAIDERLAREQGGSAEGTNGTSGQAAAPESSRPEELALKRYALIQDCLVTENDLPDPDYVDYLSEEIYNRMYGAQ